MALFVQYRPLSTGGGGGTGVMGMGAFDAQAGSADGAVVVGSQLFMQSATALVPGLVNISTQTFAGDKTFTGTITASNLSGTNTGDVTLTAVGAIPNANGASLSGQILTLQPANTSFPGVLTAADWNTFNGKQAAGAYITALTGDVTATGPGSVAATLATVNGNVGTFAIATVTVNAKGLVTAASAAATTGTGAVMLAGSPTTTGTLTGDAANFSGAITASNFTGTSSGTNTGDVTLTAVGASPNANGASLSGQALTLQPADATNPGVVTTGAQTFAGAKTFSSAIVGSVTGTAANVTGVVAIANGGTGQTTANAAFDALSPMTTGGDLIYGGASGTGTRLPNGTAGQVLTSNGTTTAPSWETATVTFTAPTVQKFLSGTAQTYTTPANVLYIRPVMVGAGGGGSGSGTSVGPGGNGSAGTATTFGTTLLSAGGGGGGGNQVGGAASTSSLGTGPIGVALGGAKGNIGPQSNLIEVPSGAGANSFFGGGGGSQLGTVAGNAATTNTGGGGGGGAGAAAADRINGSSGGAGGYVDAIIYTPAATYSYTVGAGGGGGTAGTTGAAGGAGAAGLIIVYEYYQ